MSRSTEKGVTMTSTRELTDAEKSMFNTLRQAEDLATEHGNKPLADRLYGLGCSLGQSSPFAT